MRLGKEQAIGVIEETTDTDTDGLPVDQVHEGDAGEARLVDGVEAVVRESRPLAEVPEQSALIRSR
jgi:hypothetical protein